MRREPEQDRHELEVLSRLARLLASSTRLDDLLYEIVRSASEVMNLDDCVLYLWDEDLAELQMRAAWGPKLDTETRKVVQPMRLKLGQGIVGWAASTRLVQIVDDVTVDRRYIPDVLGGGSELAVPILHQDRLVGVLDAESVERRTFGADEAVILTRIADFSAPSIVQLERHELESRAIAEALRETEFKLRHVTTHDPLTGLLDRAHFEGHLAVAMTGEGSDAPLNALVILGLERFGEINRAAGSAAGDEILRQVATVLRDRMDRGDVAARLAGVEFALLRRGTTPEEAVSFAQALVAEVQSLPVPEGVGALSPRAGVAAGGGGDRPAHLLARAERARRAAQSEGVEVASA